jgi:nicotinate-nucleotide adenylyltransferase
MGKKSRTNIGLLGGTFNPIHLGHLRAAEEAREILALDKIYFIPSAMPPHKDSSSLALPHHRLKMVELAIRGNHFFETSDVELKRSGPSYSIDTLEFFVSNFPESELYFILGVDLFFEIHTWKKHKMLFELSNFAVITRPGFPEAISIPLALKNDFRYYKNEEIVIFYLHKSSKILALLQIQGIHVSSTQIRDLTNKNKTIKYLVPKEVEVYILENKLYTKEAL